MRLLPFDTAPFPRGPIRFQHRNRGAQHNSAVFANGVGDVFIV